MREPLDGVTWTRLPGTVPEGVSGMAKEDIFYLGVKILIVNREGRILLLLRSPSGTKGWDIREGREFWDVPGGRIQRGEDIAEALRRELYEETGLQIDDRDFQFAGYHVSSARIPVGEADAGLILFVHKCKWDLVPEVRLSPEHSNLCWATPEEAGRALQGHIPPSFF